MRGSCAARAVNIVRRACFVLGLIGITALFFLGTTAQGQGFCPGNSPDDVMSPVGPWCVDTYEASVWEYLDGTGRQFGIDGDDYPCDDNGQDCGSIYAVSKADVRPSRSITWFQAQQACLLAGKVLLPNAVWQGAAAGTPDGDACNIQAEAVAATGSNADCVSRWGVQDMVGNVWEWVGDWVQGGGPKGNDWASGDGRAGTDYGDDGVFGFNPAQFQGSGAKGFPAALHRGGGFKDEAGVAGAFAVSARVAPSFSFDDIGFRCGRPAVTTPVPSDTSSD